MFKLTGNGGLRRASATASAGSNRISGLHGLRGSPIALTQHRRPAFMPDTPQEQGFDSTTSRVDEKA